MRKDDYMSECVSRALSIINERLRGSGLLRTQQLSAVVHYLNEEIGFGIYIVNIREVSLSPPNWRDLKNFEYINLLFNFPYFREYRELRIAYPTELYCSAFLDDPYDSNLKKKPDFEF
jgi:hypothetical protein